MLTKRNGVLVIVGLFLIMWLSSCTSAVVITGKATSQSTTVNVTVSASPPSLALYSPRNVSYFNSTNIILNYTAQRAQTAWYKLDGDGNVFTTQNYSYLNLTLGNHNLTLYVNNTDGTTVISSVSFYINTSVFFIAFANFYNQGDTTNFFQYGREELQNISNVVLERTSYGKISFGSQTVNLTDLTNSSFANLDDFINVSHNYIELNGSYLRGLNRSATLTLNSLSFSNPRILRDGAVCSTSVCTRESYTGGALIFNVTSFSSYSAEETPSSNTSTTIVSGSSGGGGGGAYTTQQDSGFKVSEDQFSIKLRQGEIKRKEVTITNTGTSKISLSLSAEKIERFIRLSEDKIELGPGESKVLSVDFIVLENDAPGVYIGKILVKSLAGTKELLVAIDVTTRNSLMDVRVEVQKKGSALTVGEPLIAKVELFNLGETRRVDVKVEYFIKDVNGNLIYNDHENVAVETQASIVKTFPITENLIPGRYLLYVEASYGGEVASASAWFVILGQQLLEGVWALIILIVMGIIIVLLIVYMIRKRPQLGKPLLLPRVKRSKRS